MEKVTEYKIVKETNITFLISKVNESIKDGWQPIGGLAIVPSIRNKLDNEGEEKKKDIWWYHQALVK